MTELLFLVTTIFVAYVVYVIVNEKKAGQHSAKSAAASSHTSQAASVESKPKAAAAKPKAKTATPKPAAVKAAPEKPAPAKAAAVKPALAKTAAPKAAVVKETAEKPAARKTAAKPAAPAKKAEQPAPAASPVVSQTLKGSGLKDPKSGEITTAYSNYRFTKRWIKEALVAEKLVDKVYKNEEINADIDAKIKAGLIQLENMKKYQP